MWTIVFEDKFQFRDNKSPKDTPLNKNGLFSFNIAFVLSIAEKSLHATQCLKPATGSKVVAAITDKGLHSNNTSLIPIQQVTLLILKTSGDVGRQEEEEEEEGEGVRSDSRSDLFVTQTKQRRFPGFCWEEFIPCVFVCAAKLTSCSSMAVDVEAEVSATKRSQVEVIKILPEWTEKQILKTHPVITEV